VPDVAALIAFPSPFKIPEIVVEMVRAGVAPPLEAPAKPLAFATETAVTVPLPLLLNVVQSALLNAPLFVALAVGRLNVCVDVADEILKSLPDVPVANV